MIELQYSHLVTLVIAQVYFVSEIIFWEKIILFFLFKGFCPRGRS